MALPPLRLLACTLAIVGLAACAGKKEQACPKAGTGGTATGAAAGEGAGASAGNLGPLPPPARGAFWANVTSASPPPPSKSCPAGNTLTFDLPAVDPALNPSQTLDADTYVLSLVDGEERAEVSCAVVKSKSSYTVAGAIKSGNKSFGITSGTLGDDEQGTAQITLRDSGTPGFSGALSAPSANCTIDAAAASGNSYQVKAGSIWAHFFVRVRRGTTV